jgi:hypothetical protein
LNVRIGGKEEDKLTHPRKSGPGFSAEWPPTW